jgi:hypothetical protein
MPEDGGRGTEDGAQPDGVRLLHVAAWRARGGPWSVVGGRSIWYRGIVDRLLTTRYCLLAPAESRAHSLNSWPSERASSRSGQSDGVRPLFVAAWRDPMGSVR